MTDTPIHDTDAAGEGQPAPAPAIDLVITPRERDLGGFSVKRALPYAKRRQIGPFVFLDEMGPSTFAPGQGVDVRPHPHVCLSTITFLFDGELTHRDNTGAVQSIRPGDVNWMTAGRGIVHSERTGADVRAAGHRLHGLQAWIALPEAHEETDPDFQHHPAATLPHLRREGVSMTVIAGEVYGARSPVRLLSPLFYVDAQLEPGAALTVSDEYAERAAYIVAGPVSLEGQSFEAGALLVFRPGAKVTLTAGGRPAHLMMLGGAPLSPRHIEWNFVASSKARIAQAKADWAAGPARDWTGPFTLPDGDDQEFIPLPEAPPLSAPAPATKPES